MRGVPPLIVTVKLVALLRTIVALKPLAPATVTVPLVAVQSVKV